MNAKSKIINFMLGPGLVATIFIAATVYFTLETIDLIHIKSVCTESTEATIINYRTVKSSDDSTYYYVKYRYTVDNILYENEDRTSRPKDDETDRIDQMVLYNPENPAESILEKALKFQLRFTTYLETVVILADLLFFFIMVLPALKKLLGIGIVALQNNKDTNFVNSKDYKTPGFDDK